MTVFTVRGPTHDVETITSGRGIRDLRKLRKTYGKGQWRKLKGKALVEFPDGSTGLAELHWHESHGLGRFEMKVKRVLD